MQKLSFHTIEEAIEAIKAGEMVIVLDDEKRENEGDFVMAAEKVTEEAINFMARFGRGIICSPITIERAKELDLAFMVEENTSHTYTPFTVTIDYKNETTTGVSAHDRAATVKALVNDACKASDFTRPGHMFPLVARRGGVLERPGHTEAAVDLSKLAGLKPAGVICEIMKDNGTMARRDDLFQMAEQYNLKIITIKDLIDYRRIHESLVQRQESINFPCQFGDFKLVHYEGIDCSEENLSSQDHLAFVKGDLSSDRPVLVRLHSECLTGDIFGSKRCDCGDQLKTSLDLIEKEGSGVLIYLRQEGRGIGLANKIKAYALQDEGLDTVTANHKLGFKADLRSYRLAAQMLHDLNVKQVKLLTNNPRKLNELTDLGIEVVERIPLEIHANDINIKYLMTKRDKLGHLILDEKNPLQ